MRTLCVYTCRCWSRLQDHLKTNMIHYLKPFGYPHCCLSLPRHKYTHAHMHNNNVFVFLNLCILHSAEELQNWYNMWLFYICHDIDSMLTASMSIANETMVQLLSTHWMTRDWCHTPLDLCSVSPKLQAYSDEQIKTSVVSPKMPEMLGS